MFEKGNSSNGQKMNDYSFQQALRKNLSWLLSQKRKTSKATEREQILLKDGAVDFQNSHPFVRQACFYATITGNLERFQYFNFELSFLLNEKVFQKTGVPRFS